MVRLLEVGRAQVVRDVVHRGLAEQAQRLGRDLEELASSGPVDDLDALGGQEPVCRVVTADRQQVLVGEVSHGVLQISSRVGA